MSIAIEVKNLKRVYAVTIGMTKKKTIEALKGISFTVNEGEILGLLGPNGAGKTTTIKILTTLLAPSEGQAKIFGCNCFGQEKQIRDKINFIFGGERGLYWRLSARENLQYFGDLYKIPGKILKQRIPELISLVGLDGRECEKVEGFSKGMKQRLQIARGLINDPKILFLDEPTIGLDPVGAKDLRNIVLKLKKEGKTILLTTHYMYEADELCDRIAIINNGEIIDIGTSRELKLKYLRDEKGSLEDVYIKLIGGDKNA
ncbi:ABC transporter ATP-binding protein [Clostridium estertheticum]|uniref:ABC transporter ATP-binding protein n=1 Tax=Clostridium estertheticum TaxID=238834 RepID=UPI001CD11F64|nr:ABC transporter ATP-binding protein [Clostridium estertheticum]MBZ9688540.1 ABC transporter ATP-binding protein [Clostridium estertheticum]